jgi:hypothetical protein
MEFIGEVLEKSNCWTWGQMDAKGLRDGEQFLEKGADIYGL